MEDIMRTYHSKNRIWIKTIAMVVVCLFMVNDVVWAYTGSSDLAKSGTLARWLVTRALTDAGIDDPAKVELEMINNDRDVRHRRRHRHRSHGAGRGHRGDALLWDGRY